MAEGLSFSSCCMMRANTCMEKESEVPLMQAYFADSLSIHEMPTLLNNLSAYLYLTVRMANISIWDIICSPAPICQELESQRP